MKLKYPWKNSIGENQQQHSSNANNYDLAIVGGGIVGLATARKLSHDNPKLRLVLVEKEDKLGMRTPNPTQPNKLIAGLLFFQI